MWRQVRTLVGAAWLAAISAWTPFAHLHPGDPDHHHGNGFSHPHFGHPPPPSSSLPGLPTHLLAVGDDDEEEELTVWTDWATTVQPQFHVGVSALPVCCPVIEPNAGWSLFKPQHTVRSHDPPVALRLPARSPPA